MKLFELLKKWFTKSSLSFGEIFELSDETIGLCGNVKFKLKKINTAFNIDIISYNW